MFSSEIRSRARIGWFAALLFVALVTLGARGEATPFGTLPSAAAKGGPSCPFAHSNPKRLNHSEAERSVRCLIDKRRKKHGVHGLGASQQLATAAQNHTNHMLKTGCFGHECPGEAGMSIRIKLSGYLNGAQAWGVGENVAAARGRKGSPAHIVGMWMRSPSHRATMLAPKFEHVGVGMGRGTPPRPKGSGGTYTADFGYLGG